VETLVVIVGLFVAVGTPLGTYLAARQANKVNAANAAAATQAAREATEASRQTAATINQTTQEEQGRNHFRWACEQVWSQNPDARRGGIAILKSMLHDDELDHADLVAVAGVLESVTEDAVQRLGASPDQAVAELPAAEEAGGPRSAEG
jgi:hypothetical protein